MEGAFGGEFLAEAIPVLTLGWEEGFGRVEAIGAGRTATIGDDGGFITGFGKVVWPLDGPVGETVLPISWRRGWERVGGRFCGFSDGANH